MMGREAEWRKARGETAEGETAIRRLSDFWYYDLRL